MSTNENHSGRPGLGAQKKSEDAMVHADLSELLLGIEAEADAKIANAIAGAEAYATKRINQAHSDAEILLSESRDIGQAKAHAIRVASKAKSALEQGKISMAEEERYIGRALDKVAQCLESVHREPGYRERIFAWICEAAIGLSVDKAVIDAAEVERDFITAEFLQKAEAAIAKLSGLATCLELSDGEPIVDHGVILSSLDGRIRYDNRITTRFARAQAALREVISLNLEGDSCQESPKIRQSTARGES
jgi:vacuolar-type H+-ATPase subunit E/Vma4